MANSDRTHLAGYLETPQVHFWPAPAQMAFSAGTASSRNVRFRQRAYVPPLPKHDINTHTHIENRTLTCTDLHHLATSPTTTTHPRGSLDLGNRMEQLRNLSELYFLSLCFKHTKNTHFPIHSPIGPLLNSIFTLSSNRHMKPLQGVRAWSRTNLLVGVGGVEEQCIALYQASPCNSDTHFDQLYRLIQPNSRPESIPPTTTSNSCHLHSYPEHLHIRHRFPVVLVFLVSNFSQS